MTGDETSNDRGIYSNAFTNDGETIGGTIVAAAYEGKRGDSVLFSAEQFDALAAIPDDRGGWRLIEDHEDSVFVKTDDPDVTWDIDYEDDLEQ